MKMANWFKQSLRLLQHELRRGELTIVFLAIVLAVATVFSLSGFSTQIKSALLNKSTSFIAADRKFQSSRDIPEEFILKSEALGLAHAKKLEMSSMVFANDKMQLSELNAVGELYPLRGELLVQFSDGTIREEKAPSQGSVWVEKKLASLLSVSIGDNIEIGVSQLTIAGIVTQIPDASFSVFTAGPKIILSLEDIYNTQLIQPGSRIGYKALFSGNTETIEEFEEWIKPQVNETQRWSDIKSGQSPLANALERAEKYLSLASMLGIILAAVAVAVASRRYGHRHQPTVAVLKAMGASQKHITKLYCVHWGLLSITSISVGLLIGYVLQKVGLQFMQEYLEVEPTASMLRPLVISIITGLICAIAFAIAPIQQLVKTGPLAVIRGFGARQLSIYHAIPPLLALYSLLWLFSKDVLLSFILLAAGSVVSAILLLIGRLLVNAGRSVGSKAGQSLHLAFANLKRRAKENSVQLVSFTIAIKLLLLIMVIRGGLIAEWQAQLPDDTANRFLVNVSTIQVTDVEKFIEDNDIAASGLYPVVRGRLTAINEDILNKQVTKEEVKEADQGRRGIGRELNLTWRSDLPNKNVLLEGKWWDENDQTPQVSIEKGVAERLDVVVGDKLTFQLGSDSFTVPVTSIREVDWQSLQPNFFMIFNEHVLKDFPATYISSLYIEEKHKEDFNRFMANYPTISMIDIDALISQLKSVIEQVSIAVEFILILVVIAGSLVLVAQVQASMEEREREIAILRTLGAKGSLLRNSILLEFVCLGVVAGLMASIAMEVSVFFIQSKLFDMSPSLHFEYWILGMGAGALFVGTVGMISCLRLLKMSSVTLIRRTM